MSKVESIEQQIKALSAEELAQLRAWFLEFDWRFGIVRSSATLRPENSMH